MKKGNISDTGLISDNNIGSINDVMEDSFQRMYSKELDLDEGNIHMGLRF